MVTLHTEALQARKGHVDNMAPRSKPRVKHRSSINSKGLKNKVEPSTVFADRKNIKENTRKDEKLALKSTCRVCLFLKMDVEESLNRCAAGMEEKCICEAFPEIGCKVCVMAAPAVPMLGCEARGVRWHEGQ